LPIGIGIRLPHVRYGGHGSADFRTQLGGTSPPPQAVIVLATDASAVPQKTRHSKRHRKAVSSSSTTAIPIAACRIAPIPPASRLRSVRGDYQGRSRPPALPPGRIRDRTRSASAPITARLQREDNDNGTP